MLFLFCLFVFCEFGWKKKGEREKKKFHAKQIGEAHEKCGDSFTRYNCNDFLGDLSGFSSPSFLVGASERKEE